MDNTPYIETRYSSRWIIHVHLKEKPWFFSIYVEIPLFHVLNAKVTFGNIGGGESPVAGVHAIKADIQEIDEDSETPTEQEEEPGSSAVGMAARCVIESTCFDAPAGYREVNLDQPVGE